MKTIQYFTKNVYGRDLEYVIDPADAQLITNLTGSRTVKETDRNSIEALCGGLLKFERVMEPSK